MQMRMRGESRWTLAGAMAAGATAAAAVAAVGTSPVCAQAHNWVTLGSGYSPAPAVRAVQYLLREHGHTVSVDGSYGSQTRERVRRFQRARGLEESGVVYSETWERLIVPLRRGSRGNAVRAVQSLLRALPNGKYSVALDGVFSSQTNSVVRRFQKNSGLPVDGLVGPLTWHRLIFETSG